MHEDSSTGHVCISIGVAADWMERADQGAELLAAVDAALYRAKAVGSGQLQDMRGERRPLVVRRVQSRASS